MPFLSPAKLLIILVVALVILGPDKLPRMARQIGGLWGDFRLFRERLESEVRGSFPDLPSTATITQAVRSPLSFLDNLADSHAVGNGATSGLEVVAEPAGERGDAVASGTGVNRSVRTVDASDGHVSAFGLAQAPGGGVAHEVRPVAMAVPDDPGMN